MPPRCEAPCQPRPARQSTPGDATPPKTATSARFDGLGFNQQMTRRNRTSHLSRVNPRPPRRFRCRPALVVVGCCSSWHWDVPGDGLAHTKTGVVLDGRCAKRLRRAGPASNPRYQKWLQYTPTVKISDEISRLTPRGEVGTVTQLLDDVARCKPNRGKTANSAAMDGQRQLVESLFRDFPTFSIRCRP